MSVELSETVRLLPSDNNKNSRVRTNLESFDSIVDSEKSTKCSSRLIGACLSLCIGIFLLLIVTFTETDKRIVLSATLSRTTPYKVVSHTEPVTGLWGTVTKPYPTGAFWTNLVVKTGDGAVGVHPYGVKTLDMGVQVSYGATRRWVSPLSIADSFACDLQLSSSQGYLGRSVESFDNISVTMSYKVVGGKYKTHLVKSSPFVTVVYEGATPVISSELMKFLNVEAKVMQNSVGSQYIVTLGNFQKWLVYCSEPVAFTWKDNTLTSPAPIRGFVRVAILPNNYYDKAFNVLLSYVLKYPTGASLNLTYPSGTQSTVTIQYHTVGTGSLLMLALPHHASVLEVPALNSRDSLAVQAVYDPIWDIKGKLIAVVGDVWKLQYSLVQAGWNYIVNDKLTNPQLDQIAQSLMVDVKTNLPNAADSYSFGKQIGRLARLAVIADNLGIADARQQAIVGLQNALVPWLTGANPDALMYDKVYGGLITTNGFSDPNAEFGTGWYNDHHFHYGYFINAGAVLARLSPPFFEIYRAAFDTLVRDICNYDAGDPDFPIARHKDFFDGHSWASGLFQQANGKGQESSSEVGKTSLLSKFINYCNNTNI